MFVSLARSQGGEGGIIIVVRGKERIGVFFFGEEVLNMIELKEKDKKGEGGV